MRRLLRRVEGGLFALAAVALGYCGFVWASARVFQAGATRELEELLQVRHARPTATPREGALLGQIAIPRIGLAAVIVEGSSAGTLQRAVGHIPGTALPGEAGNVCLAGHRDIFFRPLRGIAPGDEILITTPARSSVYRVEGTRVVIPENVEVLKSTGADIITLVTCYPFNFAGAAPKRFVVRAIRLQASSSSNVRQAQNGPRPLDSKRPDGL